MCDQLKEKMEENRAVYDQPVIDYGNLFLFPAEVLVLEQFREQWADFAVLDLGVGAGRTAWVFSQNAKRYDAIDYAPGRIEHCHDVFPAAVHRTFSVGDARDLSRYGDESFDFILFSYNGIDYIDPEGRERAFQEIKRVLKPGGWFFFSTHSLDAFPFRPPVPRRLSGILKPLGLLWRALISARLRWLNRKVNVREARERGWDCLVDFADTVTTYYIDPRLQRKRLEDLGFVLEKTWDSRGQEYDFEINHDEWMLHYLVRK